MKEMWVFDSWVGKIPWRRKWQLTPVFLPGEFQGQNQAILWKSESGFLKLSALVIFLSKSTYQLFSFHKTTIFLFLFFSLSCARLFATPWTVAYQAPQSMGFSRQEYWSGVPFPSPGDLPDPEIEPASPAPPTLASGFLTTEPPRKPNW